MIFNRISSSKYYKWLLPRIESLLNKFFFLNERKAKFRFITISFLFMLIWIFLALYFQPFLSPSPNGYSLKFLPITNNPILISIDQILSAFLSIDIIRRLLIICGSFYIAYFFTHKYFLVFHEFRNPKIARQYLIRNAFGISKQSIIKIENGQIENQTKQSYFSRIGGPAKVKVGLENVAVFEHPEGTVEIIGPTINLHKSTFQLSEFERLREILDLRNQTLYIDLQARTKDGIRIFLKEINLIFSVMRGSPKVTLTRPYPFRAQAVYRLVYNLPTGDWIESVKELASQFIIDFIREKTIDETLSIQMESIIERQIKIQIMSQDQKWREKRHIRKHYQPHIILIPKKRILLKTSHRLAKKVHPPIFHGLLQIPKNETSSKYQTTNTNEFNTNSLHEYLADKFQKYGISIEWINKGFWETPIQEISQNDRDNALSVEAQINKNMQSIENLRHQYRINELARLVQTLVHVDNNSNLFTTSLDSRNYIINLTNLLKNYKRFGKDIPESLILDIDRSIDFIENQIE